MDALPFLHTHLVKLALYDDLSPDLAFLTIEGLMLTGLWLGRSKTWQTHSKAIHCVL